MFGLFATATRSLSTLMKRRIASCPQRGGEKLTRTALCVYVKKHYKAAAGSSKKPFKVIHALNKKFAKLSPAQRQPYEVVAKKNRATTDKRRAVLKLTNLNGYSLFTKQNYSTAPKEVVAKGFVAVAKFISKKWKALGTAGKAKYAKQAAATRQAAVAQRERMIAAYKA